MITAERLAACFSAAKSAAESAAAENPTDEGSFNLDTALYWPEKGLRETVVLSAAKMAGVKVARASYMRARVFFVYVQSGQCSRRTRTAERAAKAMKDMGVYASVWYHLD
jgi:hypothetical protein